MSESDDLLDRGSRVRRQVLGDEHVERVLQDSTPFGVEWQEFLTRHAWGAVWPRRGLDLRTRSCITVAMLIALGRTEELAIHLRGALRNGVTREELREVLLHSAVYCGMPAANSAVRVARDVLG